MTLATQSPLLVAASADSSWRALEFWVRAYSWITVAATAYGLTIAHAIRWTNCPNVTAVFAVHLFEAPLTLYALFVAYLGIARFRRRSRARYRALLGFANVTNLVFFLFEIQLVLSGIARAVPDRHTYFTLSVAAILLAAVIMGLVLYVSLGERLDERAEEAP